MTKEYSMNLLSQVLQAVLTEFVNFVVLWLIYLIGLVGSLALSRYVESRLDKLEEDKSAEK